MPYVNSDYDHYNWCDALEILPSAYAIIDDEGFILRGNQSLATLFKTTSESLPGFHLAGLFGPENWQAFKRYTAESVFEYLTRVEFSLNVVQKDQRDRSFLWNVGRDEPVDSRSKRVFRVLGHDMTEIVEAVAKNTRMEKELATAKLVTDTLFPERFKRFGDSLVAAFYESATECGGDWFNYCMMGNRLFLWIGDVTGHGVGPALITSAVHTTVAGLNGRAISPSEALRAVGKAVYLLGKNNKYMTFLIVSIDLRSGECAYVSAGHEPALCISASGELKAWVTAPSEALGYSDEVQTVEYRAQLSPGDRLVLYTDGVADLANAEGARIGKKAFRKILSTFAAESAGALQVLEKVTSNFQDYRKNAQLDDDLSLLIFEFRVGNTNGAY